MMTSKSKNKNNTAEQVVVNGFTVLSIKPTEKSSAGHYLYLKEHSGREVSAAKPKGLTLFVLNIPPYCNEECLKRLFCDCGEVKKVHLHKNPTPDATGGEEKSYFDDVPHTKGFRVGYVVFKHPKGVTKATRIPFGETRVLAGKSSDLKTGVKKWCSNYADDNVDPEQMQEEIHNWMEEFDKRLKQEEEEAKMQEGVADEDGWVTVTRHGRNKPTARTDAQEKKTLAKDKEARKKKELLNFYAFQMRESKREHIAQLRQKFEEDKSKIEQMKSARKFRPY